MSKQKISKIKAMLWGGVILGLVALGLVEYNRPEPKVVYIVQDSKGSAPSEKPPEPAGLPMADMPAYVIITKPVKHHHKKHSTEDDNAICAVDHVTGLPVLTSDEPVEVHSGSRPPYMEK